ncbi:MAG TPA: hypothetical protein VJG32_22710 [Anaerolineae bacterium]|nr:hypothetical protein [Anaerolineae bacterium]
MATSPDGDCWFIKMSLRSQVLFLLSGICLALSLSLFSFPALPPVQATPRPTRLPDPFATPTPATQGGHGANLFYVHCMPCHGDRGQGLTDEFRTREYPPEDTDCWKSGCHGGKPYAGGFTLPKTIPALIGPDTLKRFNTAADVYEFVRRAMPFNAPGSLTETEYLQLTTFLLERNGVLPAGAALDPGSAAMIVLHAAPAPAAPAVSGATWIAPIGVALIAIGLIGWVVLRRRRMRDER